MKTLYGIAIFPIAFFIISCELPIVNSCPEKCLCGSNAVHCASKNLRRFPSNLPPRTQQLLLQNNTISKVRRPTSKMNIVSMCGKTSHGRGHQISEISGNRFADAELIVLLGTSRFLSLGKIVFFGKKNSFGIN